MMTAREAISELLGDIAGRKAVDLGAGSGSRTRDLSALGAVVTGVEPNEGAVEEARRIAGGPDYVIAYAEDTGLPDNGFDIVLFSDSLHHAADMDDALAEARRICRSGGCLVVLEPEAPDPIHPVTRWIDDEMQVYAEAQAALERGCAANHLQRKRELKFAMEYRVADADALVRDMCAVDPSRRVDADARRKVEAAFADAVRHDEEGPFLVYWERADLFAIS